MFTQQHLVIIGAGPKALAILAKARALHVCGWTVPRITVIEQAEIGAHWTGRHGYTDGTTRLGVSPVKTINYPARSLYGENVAHQVDQFSFENYLKAHGRFERWVDSGMAAIQHRAFAQYLQWIGNSFAEQILFGEVKQIQSSHGQWQITYTTKDTQQLCSLEADGLVVTGPGEVQNPFHLQYDGQRIFDGKRWWLSKQEFEGFNGRIALIGAGTTAGSLFDTLMPLLGSKAKVDWFTRRGIITRSENYSNNQVFSLSEYWQRMPQSVRSAFMAATDRGTVETSTHQTMVHYQDQVQVVVAQIQSVQLTEQAVQVSFEDGLAKKLRSYDRVICCTGFDNLGFLKLFDEHSRQAITDLTEEALTTLIEPDLAVRGILPKLHLPMLSYANVGIGCSTLGSLAEMADRALLAWVSKSESPAVGGIQVITGSVKGDWLQATNFFQPGELVVHGQPTHFTTQRTSTSLQVAPDLHVELCHAFIKANHSCDPNCGIAPNKAGGYDLMAMRAIQSGDEITWDYAMSEWEVGAAALQSCQCHTSHCRGSIGGYKVLPSKIRERYQEFTAPHLKLYL